MNKMLFLTVIFAFVALLTAQTTNTTQPWFAAKVLDLHNVLKMEIYYDNYTWSDSLAKAAQTWADKLAATDTFAYSYPTNIGENIATAVITPNTDMIQTMFNLWLAEKKYFIPWQKFPYCSTTGSWRDVGNYTQLVWGASTKLGCGLGVSAKKNVLVCQYSLPGLFIGNYPYLNKTKPTTAVNTATTTTTPATTTTTPATTTTTPATTTTTPATTTSTTTTPSTTTTTSNTTTPSTTTTTNAAPATATATANTTANGQPWFAAQLLDLHNVHKMSVNYANYTWSDTLYKQAQSWADYLASSYNFYHSGTGGVGENIATATIRNTDMIAFMFSLWSAEKKYFIPWKRFPDCSSTGNWGDVAHYTQIVWGASTELGCGVGVNPGNNVLVCQYSLAGNYIGNYVYLNKTKIE